MKMLIVLTAAKFLFFFFLFQAKAADNKIYSDSSFLTEGTEQSICYSFLPQVAQEKEPEIENWMIDPNDPFWREQESDLENWMYDVHKSFRKMILAEDKEEYPIENWMLNPSDWIIDSDVIAGITR